MDLYIQGAALSQITTCSRYLKSMLLKWRPIKCSAFTKAVLKCMISATLHQLASHRFNGGSYTLLCWNYMRFCSISEFLAGGSLSESALFDTELLPDACFHSVLLSIIVSPYITCDCIIFPKAVGVINYHICNFKQSFYAWRRRRGKSWLC